MADLAPSSRQQVGSNGAPSTRARLVGAAEDLFADKGFDNVPLCEVVAAAGQGNASAVNYHFGGRDGLLAAVLQKHQPGIERRRNALLDRIEARRRPTLRALVVALVEPAAEKLDDADGGPAYLRIMDQLFRSPGFGEKLLASTPDSARERLVGLIGRCVPAVTPQLAVLRGTLAATQLFSTLAFVARLEAEGDLDVRGRALFVGNLVDCIAGALRAPVSAAVRAASGEEPQ